MIIELLNGKKYDIEDYGLFVEDYNIPSMNIEHITESIEGRQSVIITESNYRERLISVRLGYYVKDYSDYILLRNELFSLLGRTEPFYITFKDEPKKRWYVRVGSQFVTEKEMEVLGSIDLEFLCENSFSESVGTTLDPLTFDVEKWQTGQGLITESPSYVHTQSTFKIYNASDISLDPRQLPLKIEFKGTSKNLKIINHTTGDTWEYSGTSGANDTITLNGIRSLMNGMSIFGNTNKKLITIAPGWNDFEVTGGSDFLITFDFRFYYF